MSFLRHLLPSWRRVLNDSTANAAILSAIDKELTQAEIDAIEGKVVMDLEKSTGKWLDQYGDIFGVIRRDDEDDDLYRSRIINYVLLKRGTIPAIQDAIREFLRDYDSHIEVYEPHRNIFTLNKSKLNGPDHFLGEYYTFAVIDVKIARNFPEGIIDIINEFKPAGVTVHLTYRPSAYNPEADIVELPPAGSEIMESGIRMHLMNGMNDRVRGHLNLTNRTRDEDDDSGLFILNRSKLNSLDRLAGSFSAANSTYNLASFSEEDIVFTANTAIEDVLAQTEQMTTDFYIKTGRVDDQYAAQPIESSKTSYLYFTMDVATYLNTEYPTYLREVSPDGMYTKNTYLSLMDNPKIQYQMKATTPPSSPTKYSVQGLNLRTGKWEDIKMGDIRYDTIEEKIELGSLENHLSETGLVFIRIKMNPNSGVGNYNLHLHFLEIGFHKEVAIRPTIVPYEGEVTTSSTLIPL